MRLPRAQVASGCSQRTALEGGAMLPTSAEQVTDAESETEIRRPGAVETLPRSRAPIRADRGQGFRAGARRSSQGATLPSSQAEAQSQAIEVTMARGSTPYIWGWVGEV